MGMDLDAFYARLPITFHLRTRFPPARSQVGAATGVNRYCAFVVNVYILDVASRTIRTTHPRHGAGPAAATKISLLKTRAAVGGDGTDSLWRVAAWALRASFQMG